jgi:putative oxidoreductase
MLIMKHWNQWAPLALRLVLGFGFIYHGFPTLSSMAGHHQFANTLQSIGMPLPDSMAWIAAVVEVVGGLALILGALVAIASALLTVHMLVAWWTVHLPHGFSFMNTTGQTESGPAFGMPGYEVNLLYIAGLLALILGGSGACSLERRRIHRRADAKATATHAEPVLPVP